MSDLFELEPPIDELAETESGPAHMRAPAPVSQLTKHWQAARREYIAAKDHGSKEELLALGAIRAVYWLALGSGETALGTRIGNWWAALSPVHGLGETIK
jgi:hypothetical protein